MAVLKTLNSWHSLAHSAAIAEWLFILILLLEKCRQFGAQVVPSEIRFQLKWRIFCDSWLVQFFSSAAPEILNFEPLSCFSDMWWVHCHCHVTAIWDTHDNPWYGSIVTYSPPHLLVYSPSLPPPPPPSLTSLFTIAFCFHCDFIPLSLPSGPLYAVRISCYMCVKLGNPNNGRPWRHRLFERKQETALWSTVDHFKLPVTSGTHLSLFCCLLSHFSSSYQIVVLALCVDSWLPSVFKRNWFISDRVNTQVNGREKN